MRNVKCAAVCVAVCALAVAAFADGEGKSLKDAVKGRFFVGAAVNPRVYRNASSPEARLAAREFNTITAENDMKPQSLQPVEGRFRWDAADRFVSFGETNGMKVIGHCLVWHQQTPDWFFRSDDGGPVTREKALERMRAHISAVVGRYKGRVKGWDVVNEAFDDGGRLRRTPWMRAIGPDYIEHAFRFAHAADPEAELYYNDFNMFAPGKRAAVVRLVRRLKAAGVRIDGVGMQSHVALNRPNLADYEASIVAFAAEGVKVMITELDVSVLPAAWGLSAEVSRSHDYDEKFNPWKNGILPDEMQQRLARRYEELFRIYLKHADSIDRVTFWGVADGMSWLNNFPVRGRTDYPLLFDRSLRPKPCAAAVLRLAEAASGDASGQKKSDQSNK